MINFKSLFLRSNRFLICGFVFLILQVSVFSETNEDLISSINSGNLQKLKDSISSGANPNSRDESGLPAFLLAASKGNKAIIQYLLSLEIEFTVKDSGGNSALHYLAKLPDTSLIETVLEKGLNINDTNLKGETSLHIAILKKQTKVASFLIARKPDLNKKDLNGNSLLILAYHQKLNQIFEELLKAGASPDITDQEGNTLLHIMLADGNIKSAKSLLALVPTLLNVANNDGKTPLVYVLNKNKEISFSFLMEQSPDVKILDNSKSSVLHYLAKSNFHKYIKPVIIKGAELNLKNNENETPLSISIKNNKASAFKELLANGADINIQNSDGDNAIIQIVKNSNSTFLKTVLEYGGDINTKTKEGKPLLLLAHESLLKESTPQKNKMFFELVQAGVSLDIVTTGNKPLLTEYVERGNVEIVKILLEKGAAKEILNTDGNNLLHIACILGKEDIAKVLIEKGLSISSKGSAGNTALHFAAKGGYSTLVSYLLKKGSLVDEKNNIGETAMSIAVSRLDIKTSRELIAGRANLNIPLQFENSLLMEVAKGEIGNWKTTLELISLLIKNSININAQNSFGNTALSYAINRKNIKLIEYLLKEGANPNLKDISGNNAAHKLIYTCVYDRIKNQELEDLIQTLYNYQADFNIANNDGLTPLLIAVRPGVDKDFVAGMQATKKLLDLSANVFAKDKKGKLVLDYIKDYPSKDSKSIDNDFEIGRRIDKDFNPVLPNTEFTEISIAAKTDNKNNIFHLIESRENNTLNQYSSSGQPVSSIRLARTIDFEIAKSGNIYTIGETFDKIQGITDSKCKLGESKIITVRKLNISGEELWIKYFLEKGACSKTKAIGIVLDGDENIYLGMSYGNSLNYILKLSTEGELKWKQKTLESFQKMQIVNEKLYFYGNKLNEIQLDGKREVTIKLGKLEDNLTIAYDRISNSYFVAGKLKLPSKREIIFISKYNLSKNLEWTKYFSSGNEEILSGISTDGEGSIYLYGMTDGNLHNRKKSGGKDGFILKLDSNGNRVWTELIGSESDDFIQGVLVMDNGQILVHGITKGSLFNSFNKGLTDVFLIKLQK